MKKLLYIAGAALLLLTSCQSVDFEKTTTIENDIVDESIKNIEDEQERNAKEVLEYQVEEELKEIDIEKSVVYVEKPVY